MTPDNSLSSPSTARILASPKIRLRFALASGAILAAGSLMAPTATPTALSTPQERPAPLLEEQAQVREVPRPFTGVQDTARRTAAHGVAIAAASLDEVMTTNDFSSRETAAFRGGSGVFVSDTDILTHEGALDGRASVEVSTADGRTLTAGLAAYEAESGLILLKSGLSGVAPAPLGAVQPEHGSMVVATARTPAGELVQPMFVAAADSGHLRLSARDGAVVAGTPVYDLDGQLVALATNTDAGVVAFPARAAVDRLSRLASSGTPQSSFGLGLQDLTGPLTQLFGEQGVLINEVVAGGPAQNAGLRPGDVLVSVGTTQVASLETTVSVLRAQAVGSAVPVAAIRDGRELGFEVVPLPAYEVAVMARRQGPADAHPLAQALLPTALLEAARLGAEDQVLAINGKPVSTRPAALREIQRSGRPAVILARRDGRAFFTVVGTGQ